MPYFVFEIRIINIGLYPFTFFMLYLKDCRNSLFHFFYVTFRLFCFFILLRCSFLFFLPLLYLLFFLPCIMAFFLLLYSRNCCRHFKNGFHFLIFSFYHFAISWLSNQSAFISFLCDWFFFSYHPFF